MTLYECEIRHVRTAPLRNVFRYRSYLWLVDVDHLPRIPLLTVFRARDHLGATTTCPTTCSRCFSTRP